MADLICPTCGKSNPDFLDFCQFCQTPLRTDSVLHIGESPTKKDTGELEAVLPDWLRNVRQQARTSAQEDDAQEAVQPKSEKKESPDLLAGLVSQSSDAGEDEIPDWLASINPAASPKPASAPAPAPEESDFFAQFSRSEAKPAGQPAQAEVPPAPEPAADQAPAASTAEDDLSKWFAQAAQQPEEIVELDSEAQAPGETAWPGAFDASRSSQPEPAPKEEEDLSWLHNLEDVAKQTGDLPAPKQGADWMADFEAPATPSAPSQPQEDLSWLDNLGGIEETPSLQQTSAQPDDLSWLNNLDAVTQAKPFEVPPEKPASAPPFAAGEDLSWLDNLGGTPAPAQPAQAAPGLPSAPQEDLSWLSDLAAKSEAPSAAPFTEFATPAPTPATPASGQEEAEPDWLKRATEVPSTPAPADVSMDWFAKDQSTEQPAAPAEATPAAQTPQSSPALASRPGASVDQAPGAVAPSEPASLSSQDVDSLFSVEMPDWLSRAEPGTEGTAPQESALPPAAADESLAPVDLPSWVQAMRPVEAVISETTSGAEEEPEEKEGPLAGLRGVIPGASIGSSVKPKSISLKLQASNEQQASAALLEKILESETSPRALITSSFIWSQQGLRWALTALFLIVLSAMVFLRSEMMPPSATLPVGASQASTAIDSLTPGAKVLVVIDYEPALAGEMEALGSPLLEHMVLLRRPSLSFLSTSPNGVALADRLMSNEVISPADVEYRNLGFLPGGSMGVLGFIEGAGEVMPASEVGNFSDYAMLILMTDQAESGRVWVEQLQAEKVAKPLIVIASAQAGPLLQPYLSSQQITGMLSGLSEAARYEYKNALPPVARSYLDTFGIGLAMAIVLIIFGSLWSLFTGIRARRAEAEQG